MRTSVSGLALITILLTVCVDVSAQSDASAGPTSWAGFYIGLNAGRGWKNETNVLTVVNDSPNSYFNPAAIPGVNASGTTALNDNGFSGGGQIGYNSQSGNVVLGTEGDFVYLGLHPSYGGTFAYTTDGSPYQLVTSEPSQWMFTIRPRLGWALDRWLLYGTGGFAVSHARFQQDFSEGAFTPVPMQLLHSQAKLGWAVGAGMEVALGRHWSGRGEYLFNRFGANGETGKLSGASSASGPPGFVDGATFNNSISSMKIHVVRFGLNFRF
jgi:outer membrane immunogenic protein